MHILTYFVMGMDLQSSYEVEFPFRSSLCARLPDGVGMYPVWWSSILDASPVHRCDTWAVLALHTLQPEFLCHQCSYYSDDAFNCTAALALIVACSSHVTGMQGHVECNLTSFYDISLPPLTIPTQEDLVVDNVKIISISLRAVVFLQKIDKGNLTEDKCKRVRINV